MVLISNLFIILYLICAWSWHLPVDSFARRIVCKASPAIVWLGLWHSWKMFAPRPSLVNSRLSIELVYADGRKSVVDELNLSELGRWSAFLNCRERKYQLNLAGPDYKTHWDALCRYAAKHYADEGAVVRVSLMLAQQRIAKPGVFMKKPFLRTRLWTRTIQD